MPTPFVIDPNEINLDFMPGLGYMPVLDLPILKFKRLTPTAILPTKGSPGAACWDLYADEDVILQHYRPVATISTGIGVAVPPGHVGFVCSRSGLASKDRIFVVNAPGVIDEDYRGELKVILSQLPSDMAWPNMNPYTLPKGSRIAQFMVMPLPLLTMMEELGDFDETERGGNGLGSTGI